MGSWRRRDDRTDLHRRTRLEGCHALFAGSRQRGRTRSGTMVGIVETGLSELNRSMTRLTFGATLVLVALLSGCGPSDSVAVAPPLLQPCEGVWRFDTEKTLQYWESHGTPAAEISQARKLSQSFPLHPDMTIAGTVATLSGFPPGEYAFFALHSHDRWVCGKAWHHEDRNDPGDMSKYFVRLERKGDELHFSVRSHEKSADPADPDIGDMPATSGSAKACDTDKADKRSWSPWATFVFVRK